MSKTQRWRYLSLALFFLVFFLTPVTDLFRYDLYQHHFILLGKPLSLGLGREENLKLAPLPAKSRPALLKMLDKGCALNESGHDFGKREGVTRDCF